MNEYLEQIAKLLLDSADVPTDASDVADEVAIVQTVKNALDMLYDARGDVDGKSRDLNTMAGHLKSIAGMLVASPDIAITDDDLQLHAHTVQGVAKTLRYLGDLRRQCAANAEEIERYSANISELHDKSERIREQFYAAQQEIGALTAKLEAAQRTNVSYSGQLEGWQGRYEGLSEALSMAMDKLAAVR